MIIYLSILFGLIGIIYKLIRGESAVGSFMFAGSVCIIAFQQFAVQKNISGFILLTIACILVITVIKQRMDLQTKK